MSVAAASSGGELVFSTRIFSVEKKTKWRVGLENKNIRD
jgi:hypothetical protein